MDEANLIQLLDEVATDGRITAAARHATKDHGRVTLGWRCEMQRPFADLVDIAKRIGDVRELQRVRGITIDGRTQFVLDPYLLERFGMPDDPTAADMAELSGYPHYPWALDAGGNKIPLLSPRHPRPQRSHRPAPQPPKPPKQPDPSKPLPAYARGVNAPATKPVNPLKPTLGHLGKHPKPKPIMTPLRAELMARAQALREHGPAHSRPLDNRGRPTFAATTRGLRADDPPEQNG